MRMTLFAHITTDFSLNIAATFLSTGIMQLLLYPTLSVELNAKEYGIALTVIGYMNVITLSFGNNLCYARLLQQQEYDKRGIVGDYQILIVFSALISSILIFICTVPMKLHWSLLIGVIIATITTVLKSYYLVIYRIIIDYKKIFIANAYLSVGFVIGGLVLIKFVSWPWIFSLANILMLIYIWNNSSIMHEPFSVTCMFRLSLKTISFLIISGIIANITMYLDRFILYPTLGAESVSIFAVATFFAKSIDLIIAPITSVLLSYLINRKIFINKSLYIYINIILIVIGVIIIFISSTIGMWLTGILYPYLIIGARPFVLYASIGIIIGTIGSFINMVVLAYAPVYWQTVVPSLKLILYFVLGLIMINYYEIKGLCVTVIATNTLANILNFAIGYHYIFQRGKHICVK